MSDNAEDVERIVRLGGIIAQSDVDGVIAGPLRVWPGGLMMTRSLGDASAGNVSVSQAEAGSGSSTRAG